ncbi:hypothetical protein [Actinophytocola sediminis]
MRFSSGDGFSTQQMIQAERELDGRIDFAFSKARELQAKVEEVEEKLARNATPLTHEDVERFRAYILGHARTDEWQLVIDRIDKGELIWRGIVEGVDEGTLDREVTAAMASLSKVPPASVETLVEIGVLPDLNPSTQDTEDTEDTDKPDKAAVDEVDDEEWGEDQSIFNR